MAKKKNGKEEKNVEKTKKEKETIKNNGISPINRFNILFVDLQIVFTVATLGCFIWYMFNSKVIYALQAVLGITLIISGYNNKIIYNRKKMTYVYYVIGIGLLILDVLMLLGV